MTIDVTLARADPDEIDAIAEIDRAAFTQGTLNVFAELERPWARIWVARPAGEHAPRAFLFAWHVADELHVLGLATTPAHRRRGLASALLGHAIAFAHEHEARRVLLEVRRSNEGAIRLYRRFGFAALGIRARYYADDLEDAVEMAVMLDPVTGRPLAAADEVSV